MNVKLQLHVKEEYLWDSIAVDQKNCLLALNKHPIRTEAACAGMTKRGKQVIRVADARKYRFLEVPSKHQGER